jgi:hypothetical protein
MANELAHIPDFMKMLAAETVSVFDDAKSLGRSMPPSIYTASQKFNLKVDGNLVWPMSRGELDFIVVGAKRPNSRGYYEGTYDADNKGPPTCYSIDGVTPEEDSTKVQHERCLGCPKSEWGSRTTDKGEDSTACRPHKQLAVKVLGEPGLYRMNIPVASIKKQWDVYASKIEEGGKAERAKYGYETMTLGTVVTRASIDDNIWSFKPLGYIGKILSNDEGMALLDLVKSGEAVDMLWGSKERKEQYEASLGKPSQKLVATASAPAPASVSAPMENKQKAVSEPPFDMSYEPPGEPVPKKQEAPRVKAQRTPAPAPAKAPAPAPIEAASEEDVDDFLKDLGL